MIKKVFPAFFFCTLEFIAKVFCLIFFFGVNAKFRERYSNDFLHSCEGHFRVKSTSFGLQIFLHQQVFELLKIPNVNVFSAKLNVKLSPFSIHEIIFESLFSIQRM